MERQINVFERYRSLKKNLSFIYKGYHIEEILAIRIWFFCQEGCPGRLSFRLRKDYGNLFNLKKNYIAIYGKYNRLDHENTFDYVTKRLQDKYDVLKLENLIDVKYQSIKNILYSIYVVFIFLRKCVLTLKQRFYWCSLFCYVFNTIDYLESMPKQGVKKVLCFSAVHEDENILKQYYKKNGAMTYSMFHGVPVFHPNAPTIDNLIYENLDVDYSLPWGQSGKDEFVKVGYPSKNLLVAGYPRKMTLMPLKNSYSLLKGIILMARSQYEETDLKLMDMLSDIEGMKFSIKLHPSCDESKFIVKSNEQNMNLVPKSMLLSDCLNNKIYDFAIAINTTSYYEALLAGLPCLRFKDGDKYAMMKGDEHDEFEDKESFNQSLTWLRSSLQELKYDDIRQSILKYCLGFGIDNYRSILL